MRTFTFSERQAYTVSGDVVEMPRNEEQVISDVVNGFGDGRSLNTSHVCRGEE
jgi:hypothetical protein